MLHSLTLRGILRSTSGNEITPNTFPVLRTTMVASICRVIEAMRLSISGSVRADRKYL